MAKQEGLKFEAEVILDDLKNQIAEAQAKAHALAAQETDLLDQAETVAQGSEQVVAAHKALQDEWKALMPLLKILGRTSEVRDALGLLKDEANAMIAAAKDKQEELHMEAALLWEGNEKLKKLVLAEQEIETKRQAKEAEALEAKVTEAIELLRALVQGESLHGEKGLLALYPKRHGAARRGDFGPATPDDANSIRLEMLRRALRGAGFFPNVIDRIPDEAWEEANKAFMAAQTVARNAEQRAAISPEAMSTLEKAVDTLMACGVPAEYIDLTCLPDKGGQEWVRGSIRGTKIEEKVDRKGRWLVNLQNTAASLHA